MAIKSVFSLDNLGTWMDLSNIEFDKVNPKLTAINVTPLNFIPTPTGNITNLNELVTGSDGAVYFIDYGGDSLELLRPPVVVKLAEDVDSTTTTLSNLAGMSFNVLAGKSYEIKLRANRTSSQNANGARVSLISTSAGFLSGNWDGSITPDISATNRTQPVVFGIEYVPPSSDSTTAVNFLKFDVFYTATTSGVIQLQWGSEVNGRRSTILAGSAFVVTQLD